MLEVGLRIRVERMKFGDEWTGKGVEKKLGSLLQQAPNSLNFETKRVDDLSRDNKHWGRMVAGAELLKKESRA